jgi:hypothetical protein
MSLLAVEEQELAATQLAELELGRLREEVAALKVANLALTTEAARLRAGQLGEEGQVAIGSMSERAL